MSCKRMNNFNDIAYYYVSIPAVRLLNCSKIPEGILTSRHIKTGRLGFIINHISTTANYQKT
jgi:hypothetical protein